MTLDELPTGRSARIQAVNWADLAQDEAKRLQALGIDQGTDVSISHRGILAGRDPLAVRIGRMTIALRRSHARAISLETE